MQLYVSFSKPDNVTAPTSHDVKAYERAYGQLDLNSLFQTTLLSPSQQQYSDNYNTIEISQQ